MIETAKLVNLAQLDQSVLTYSALAWADLLNCPRKAAPDAVAGRGVSELGDLFLGEALSRGGGR
jgi:hypothetical protein